MNRLLVAALLAAAAFPVLAETAQAFAERINKTRGVSAVVNVRDDQSLGSISIGVPEKLVADREALGALLVEVGKFAAEQKLRAVVVTPTQADSDYVVGKFKAAGTQQVTTKVMAESVSNRTSRIFLTPAPKPAAR